MDKRLHVRYFRMLIDDLHPGGYGFRHLRGLSGRCNSVSKFRNLGSNQVCSHFIRHLGFKD